MNKVHTFRTYVKSDYCAQQLDLFSHSSEELAREWKEVGRKKAQKAQEVWPADKRRTGFRGQEELTANAGFTRNPKSFNYEMREMRENEIKCGGLGFALLGDLRDLPVDVFSVPASESDFNSCEWVSIRG